jgi:hypothetical protein
MPRSPSDHAARRLPKALAAATALALLPGCLFMKPYDQRIPLSETAGDQAATLTSETVDWRIAGQDEDRRHEIVAVLTLDGPVVEGGALKLSLGHLLPTEQRIYTPFSLTATSAAFFKINLLQDVAVECSNPAVKLKVTPPRAQRSMNQMWAYIKYKRRKGKGVRDSLLRQIDNEFALHVAVARGQLAAGDTVRITLGAKKGLEPPPREASLQIIGRLDADGDGQFGLLEPAPSFDVYSGETAQATLVGPSTLRPGETSRAVLKFEDSYYLPNLARFGSATVRLDPTPGLEHPTEWTVAGDADSWDASLLEFAVTRPAVEEGADPPAELPVVRITGQAVVDGKTLPIESNPIALFHEGARGAYFGDTHLHSVVSYDADRPPSYVWWRVKHQERHDWAAVSDHDMIGAVPFASKTGIAGITDSEWAYLKSLADEWDAPGEFTAFKAYEWTSYFYGHRNVYFGPDEADPPIVHHNLPSDLGKDDELDPVELSDALGAEQYVAIPHSTAWPTGDTEYHWGPGEGRFGDPTSWPNQLLIELYSTHGSSEHHDPEYAVDQGRPEAPTNDPVAKDIMGYNIRQAPADSGNFVRDALAAGWRFGFIGSSDMHYLSHIDQAYTHGIAGVWADDLSRRGIWDAWQERRTWATTGVRITVEFAAGETFMGGEVAPGPTTLTGRVLGTGELEFVQLVRWDGDVWSIAHEVQPDGADATVAFDTTLQAGDIWYLRARQDDGHWAWGSPVWVGGD